MRGPCAGEEGDIGVFRSILDFFDRHQEWFSFPLVVVMALTAFVLAFARPDFLEQIELKTLDQRFKLRGQIEPDARVVILAVDDDSITEIGRWPWPRDRIADLIDKVLGEYGAKALGFDIVFSEPQRNPLDETLRLLTANGVRPPEDAIDWLSAHREIGDADAHLAAVLHRWRDRVALGYFFHPQGADVPLLARADLEKETKLLQPSAMTVEVEGRRMIGLPRMAAVEGNIPRLTEAVEVAGFFNFFPDADGMVRRVPLVATLDGFIYPSLDLQTLRLALGWPELAARVGAAGVDEIRLGDRVIATDRSGGMLLNHYGPAQTFRHVAAADVLKGRVDPASLKDAIVVFGVTAKGVYDYRPSPFDSTFPGVEGHAAAMSNILRGEEIRRPGMLGIVELFGVLLLSLATGRMVLRRGPVIQSIAIVGAPLAIVLLGIWLFAAYGIWLKVTYLILGVLMATLPVTLLEYVIESHKRAFIHDAFSHYLPPKVVEILAQHPEMLKLGGEERHLTAFFSDIASFSTFSEGMSPADLVAFLNRYLSAMSDIILDHGGTIDKYEGDAIIAFFGAPVEMPDHATRCVLAALDQQAMLSVLRREWQEEGLPEVHVRMGVNSGPMVVGNMGTQTRMNYTIMGDHVNLAARLEGVNKVYRTPILMSHDTYQLARETVAARFVDMVRVVGRSQPVGIYQPVGTRDSVDPAVLEGYRLYEKAWNMMRRRHFTEAEKLLVQLAVDMPGDGPTEVMLARVRGYLRKEPPPNWDGVFTLSSK
ncbi:MAG: adenylate/guanylate cyclase domain-containing protein [Mariprofundaceae bacterium]